MIRFRKSSLEKSTNDVCRNPFAAKGELNQNQENLTRLTFYKLPPSRHSLLNRFLTAGRTVNPPVSRLLHRELQLGPSAEQLSQGTHEILLDNCAPSDWAEKHTGQRLALQITFFIRQDQSRSRASSKLMDKQLQLYRRWTSWIVIGQNKRIGVENWGEIRHVVTSHREPPYCDVRDVSFSSAKVAKVFVFQ